MVREMKAAALRILAERESNGGAARGRQGQGEFGGAGSSSSRGRVGSRRQREAGAGPERRARGLFDMDHWVAELRCVLEAAARAGVAAVGWWQVQGRRGLGLGGPRPRRRRRLR